MRKLKEKYGFWGAYALTLSGAIGASLLISFNMVTFLAGFDPVFLVLTWIIGGFAILPENLLLIEPAINYPENGTTYAWIKRAKWKVIAFWFGWVLVMIVGGGALAGATIALGQISSVLVDSLTKTTNWSKHEWIGKAIALSILIFFVVMQIFVKNSGKYSQYVFSILKLLPIVFIIIMAIVYGNFNKTLSMESRHTINKSMGSIFVSAGLLIPAITYTSYAYSGTEFSTYITGEIREPRKTVPKVIVVSLISIVLIYVIFGITLLSLTSIDMLGNPGGTENSSPSAQPVPSNLLFLPTWAKVTFQFMSLAIFIGSINTLLITYTGLVHKLSVERDLFKIFKKRNKNNITWMSMLLLVSVAVIYVLVNDLYMIVGYFTISVSILKTIMATTTLYLRKTDPNYRPLYGRKVFYTILGFTYFASLFFFVGGIMAIFWLNPESAAATKNLVFNIIFMVVLILLIPIGYLKFYFQDYRLKQQVREDLYLKTKQELKELYASNPQDYRQAKKLQNQQLHEELEARLELLKETK